MHTMLMFKNVGLEINKNKVLKDLSFKIVPGEMVAILGESGAGKSSLFSLLIGEKKPSSGEILLDEFSLGELSFDSVQKYRRQIGIIFQDFRLLPQKTVEENIAFALEVCGEEEHIKRKIPQLLEVVGLKDRAKSFPSSLSGGEKQRVAIARALIHEPKILIADEATGNLDPKNSKEIAELFLHLNKTQGLTLLFATHDPILVQKLTPRVIRLEEGAVLFDEYNCDWKKAFSGLL